MDEETHGTGCFNIMHQRAAAAAKFLRVSVSTMYNWINLRTVMDGENMLLAIDLLMGGRYIRRGTE